MPKVIQITGLTQEGLEGVHPPGCGIAILTDTGEIYERWYGGGGKAQWFRTPLPWEEVKEVPFAECQNPDCPIGCPDSHALDCIETIPEAV